MRTDTISFPPVTTGLEAITQVLVRDFARTYENVYTFCLTDEPEDAFPSFRCGWLVGMSEKATGSVRVGCGTYDWSFQAERPYLAKRLTIDIEVMKVLSADALGPVMAWLTMLPYPWCPVPIAIRELPGVPELAEIREFVGRVSESN